MSKCLLIKTLIGYLIGLAFVDQTGDKQYGNGREEYFSPYDSSESLKRLNVLVVQQMDSGAAEPGSEVPFIPTYTFNVLDASQNISGEVPKEEMDVVIRLVSTINVGYTRERADPNDDPNSADHEGWLPNNVQLTTEPLDGAEEIIAKVENNLKKRAKEEQDEIKHAASNCLYVRGEDGELVRRGW